MQSLLVNSNDVEIGYYASGPPSKDAPYTTLVIIHGHTFNAANFSRTVSRAKYHGLRVVSLARRDYAGSTLFSNEEMDQLRSSDKISQFQFLRDRGYEIARFLAALIDRHDLPPIDARGTGGLSLLAWSLGNVTMNAFVYFFSTYPRHLQEKVGKHLKSLVACEPPQYVMRQGDPEWLCLPLWDNSIPEAKRGLVFCEWVSSYYSHPYFQPDGSTLARNPSSLSEGIPTGTDRYRPSTFETYTAADREKNLDKEAGERSDRYIRALPHETTYEVASGALLLSHPVYAMNALPGVRVHFIFGKASAWTIPWCHWLVEEYAARWESEGRGTRIGHIVTPSGANHFLHWDDPDRFLSIFKEYFDAGGQSIRGKL